MSPTISTCNRFDQAVLFVPEIQYFYFTLGLRPKNSGSRAQTILDMVKEEKSNQYKPTRKPDPAQDMIKPKQPEPKTKPGPDLTEFINRIYAEPYSMTSTVFDTFCETQVTYNSHHLLSLSTQSLFNEFKISPHQNTVNSTEIDLTCNELMLPLDFSPLDEEIPLNMEGTCENSPLDFDSDDSVIDKDYCPSDSSESHMSDVPESGRKTKKKTMKTNNGNHCSILPVDNEDSMFFNLKSRRRNSIGTCKESTPERLCHRKRCKSVDGNYCSTLSDILQLPRKIMKHNTPGDWMPKIKKKREHCVKPGCNEKCIKKCMTLLNQEDREAINKSYWDMSWQEQHAFVEAHTYVAVPKRKITSEPKRNPRRNFVLKKQDGTRKDVCKIFFLTTLGYLKNNDRILHPTFTDSSIDKRGKHQKTPAFDRDLLNQHVESFNPLEPHYRREHAPLRRYLPSDVNITQMHKHFCETYPDRQVSYSLYRSHLKNMKISFTALGNEECELCESYNFHKKETSHDATVQILENCTSMLPENFLNIPNYVSQRRIQTSNPRAYLKNIVEVCFVRKSYDLMYKNNLNDAYTTLRFMNDRYLKNPRTMVFKFRTEPKGIEPKRKADLLKNLSNIIPPHKLLFWKNLPTREIEQSVDDCFLNDK
ncbi:hypothetical protein HW555_009785 [Spodoptera exigua]|uniref:Uncharacterized protein n=1 Tax=Spodoptera exigua TaxID=7107 RepID=A0A835GBP3_SPOEX|nr:hypothetical protein HW555_009785 [Spodoptera exigua]